MKRLIDLVANANPWLVFTPFLLLYLVLTQILAPHEGFVLDEARYWEYANNLLEGHFHSYQIGEEGYQFLWNGPGYPIFLMPFAAMDSPSWVVKLSNAVFLYLAVVYLLKMLRLYVPSRKAFLFALAFACYFPMYKESLWMVMTEAMAIFLTTFAAYQVSSAFVDKDFRWKRLSIMGLSFAALALTKVLLGYVFLGMIFVALAFWLVSNRAEKWLHLAKVFGLALVFCTPYLIYTFSLTGKVFYWGNSGGLQLYWMASPYPEELGDWHSPTLDETPIQKEYHGAFFATLKGLGPVERDEALKRKAIENIKQHPKKFIYNWIANWGRTFFSHPLSFLKPSNGLFVYLLPNMFLIVLSTFAGVLSVRFARLIPTEILALVMMVGVYLLGTSLLSSYVRFLYPVIPILLVWIAYSIHRFVKVQA